MTKQLTTVFLASSLLVACGHGIKNPDANVYIVQAKDKKIRGYNLREHYDSQGNRKPDAKPIQHPVSQIEQLDGWMCSDDISAQRIQIFARDVRDYIKDNCTCK